LKKLKVTVDVEYGDRGKDCGLNETMLENIDHFDDMLRP
jgi:hypothetical protein